jgi:hypothetical protein
MAENKAGHWKFREANLTTGKPYFDWVPGSKARQGSHETPAPTQGGGENPGLAPLTPKERGNYTADIDSAAADKREEDKEAAMRKARGLPPEE